MPNPYAAMTNAQLQAESDKYHHLYDYTELDDPNFDAIAAIWEAIGDEIERRYRAAAKDDPDWELMRYMEIHGDVPRMLTA